MPISYGNIKDFERIHTAIKNSRTEWENGSIKPGVVDSYKGIWKNMNQIRRFMMNEYNDGHNEFKKLGNVYNSAVVSREKKRFDDEFAKMTAVAKSAFCNLVTEFTNNRHKKVTAMLRTAPTESMKIMLETLKMRDDLDMVELYDIMPMFYENYHAIRVLQAIGRQNGITLGTPVQMDATAMHQAIDKASEYLMGACNEMFKPITHYKDFFTVNDEESETIYSPVFKDIVAVLDSVPQLQDFTAKKTALSRLEKIKVDWHFRNLPENASKTEIARRTKEVMEKYPEDISLIKLSDYAEYVEIVETAHDSE